MNLSIQEADNVLPVVSGTTQVEPDYEIPVDDNETIPTTYDDVLPAYFTELGTNSRDESNTNAYQGLLIRDLDYVIPAAPEPSNKHAQ